MLQDIELIDVVMIMMKAHEGQTRMDRITPYFTHPLQVYAKYEEIYGKPAFSSGAACLLHDVVEDCEGWDCTRIACEVSPDTATLVHYLTKPKRPNDVDKLEFNKKSFEKLRNAPEESLKIKMCDRLMNLSDVHSCGAKFLKFYVADSVNLYGLLKELETPKIEILGDRIREIGGQVD